MKDTFVVRVPTTERIIIRSPSGAERIVVRDIPPPGAPGVNGLPGPAGANGTSVTNIDGGRADSTYGSLDPLDGGTP